MNSPIPSDSNPAVKRSASDRGAVLSIRTLRVIFLASFLSVVAYAVVGTFILRGDSRSVESLQAIYKVISFAGGLCVAGLLLIRNLMNRDLSAERVETEAAFQAGTSSPRNLRNRKLSLLAFAVSEMIAVLGLVFVLMGGRRQTLYLFCAISLACLILFFPKQTN